MACLCRLVVAGSLFFLGVASPAAAEPIRITGGSLLVTGAHEVAPVSIAGTRGFSLTGMVDPAEGNVRAITSCGIEGCEANSTIDIGAVLGGPAFPGSVATLDGVTYDDIDNASSPASVFFILTGSLALPGMGTSPVTVSAPFTLDTGRFFRSFPLEGVEIVGSGGTATLRFIPGMLPPESPGRWVLDQIQYDFSDSAPVPEPATMLLVAGGVLAIIRRRSQRSHPTSSDRHEL
jgi:hypothetical protein